MAESELLKRENKSVYLINPCVRQDVTADWFEPEYWGSKATSVSSGGRGGAWFIDAGDQQFVLREYLRGGLVSLLSRNIYIFAGESRVRSFSEFRLLNRLVSMLLPVPRPVAASYRHVSPTHYCASIIIERIPKAVPLAELIGKLSDADWRELGRTIRRFHDACVRHADLNCFNVLISEGSFFLIDFDKGCIMPPDSGTGWKRKNLDRFARSLTKVAGEAALNKVWGPFIKGYEGGSDS